MYQFLRFVAGVVVLLVTRRRMRGQEQTPRSGGLLIVSNHLGLIDPLVIGTKLPRQLSILAKVELFSWPVVGWLARKADVIPVRRGQSDRDAIRRLLEQLEAGHAVLVFPEGTYPQGKLPPAMMKAQPGAAMLALRSGATILPVGISGTEHVWTRRGLPWNLFWRWRVQVNVGAPYRPSIPPGASQKQALALVTEEMMQLIAALLPESYRGHYAERRAASDEQAALTASSLVPEPGTGQIDPAPAESGTAE